MQIYQYVTALHAYNQTHNVTALESVEHIIERHVADSLALTRWSAFYSCKTIADVGSGPGIPGIILAIARPDAHVILIEVNQKRVTFLHMIIAQLGLSNVTVYQHDWRTFLRDTVTFTQPVDLFCARASLAIDELLRVFKPSSHHRHAYVAYWASAHWQPTAIQKSYIVDQLSYENDNKQRHLIIFCLPKTLAPQDGNKL